LEILDIRDRLYAVASAAVALHRSASATAASIGQLDADGQIEVAERAAILEFDGDLSRDQAERLALSMYNSRVSGAN
jgi:hypothetical protein